jgi:transcriptional regulator with XRE-family HTH domain
MAPGGRRAKRIALPRLRAARQARGWTEDDLAAAVLDIAERLGEPEPRISAGQVSKWERGDRHPGLYYRARLCMALECTPDHLGFTTTPTLIRSIRALMEHVQECPRRRPHTGQEPASGYVDMDRLRATLTHLWPVDGPLVGGLDRVSRELARRRDTEPPPAVMPDLSRYLDMLIELVSRSQRPDHGRELRRIAAYVGQNLAMASWVSGDAAATTRSYAVAESLARESRCGSQLAMILVDRSEMAGQVARAGGEREDARALADAAETAALMDPDTPPGVMAWIYGERSLHRAELGDECGSGRDIERMEEVRLSAPADGLNVFSPGLPSAWVDAYHARRALRVGNADEALAVTERILASTDWRLHWERAETLIQLAEAWILKGELCAAADRLRQAIELLRSTGNARDIRGVHRAMNQIRQRWGRPNQLRELDEALRG